MSDQEINANIDDIDFNIISSDECSSDSSFGIENISIKVINVCSTFLEFSPIRILFVFTLKNFKDDWVQCMIRQLSPM